MANSKLKCRYCGDYFPREQIRSHPNHFCSNDHFIEHQVKKGMAAVEKRKSEKNKADREQIKTKYKWMKEAQKAFNLFIGIRDNNTDCISCDVTWQEIESEQRWKVGGAWDAGHFRTRGAAGHLRFNTYNVHRQCKSCNAGGGKFSHKAATVDARYREKLIERIGLEKVEALESDNSTRGFDIEYLKRVKKIFSRRARLYKRLFRNE